MKKKQLNKDIEQAIRMHEENLFFAGDIEEKDIRQAIRWVMRDNPDIFWFAHQYVFDNESKCLVLKYQFSEERSRLIQDSIDDVIEQDFQIAYVRNLEVYEQVAYVYKWLLSYCNYNVNSAYNQTIDSVFVRRNSVCTGYAKAAQYLFKLLGIDSKLVFGRLNNDIEKGRHCWNVVCINGEYFHLDVCLGDIILEKVLLSAGASTIKQHCGINWNCFCVSDEEIKKTRSIEYSDFFSICDNCISLDRLDSLYNISIRKRNRVMGCLLSKIGSSADIYLCSLNNNVVLKKFRESDNLKCLDEYRYMNKLRGCAHLLQLNEKFTDTRRNIIAIEQSTPIVDLFSSRYYHPSLAEVLLMACDVIKGWQECYERGILYRDIHICNVYKANNGLYKLGDFGSCCCKPEVNEKVGNVWFMSPETYMNGVFDERSAVYSITSLLYFVLNGLRPAFIDGDNEDIAIYRKMHEEEFPLPVLVRTFPNQIKSAIHKLLKKGCAHNKEERFSSTKDMLQIINALLDEDDKKVKSIHVFLQIPHGIYYDSILNKEIFKKHYIECPCEDVEENSLTGFNKHTYFNVETDDVGGESLFDTNHFKVFGTIMLDSVDAVENYCQTMGVWSSLPDSVFLTNENVTYVSSPSESGKLKCDTVVRGSILRYFIKKVGGIYHFFMRKDRQKNSDVVYSSIFAPSEIKPKTHFLVQVYLHLFDETEQVKSFAQESQKDAERRDYIPLKCRIKRGNRVDVTLNIFGETLLMSKNTSVVWQGHFSKCSFDYFVPESLDVGELSCVALMTINGIPVGESRFITNIVESPRKLNTEIISHRYSKIFISYAHKDEWKVKSFHEGLKLMGVEHFFDRDYLKAGDIFPQVIQDYINSADLFVLFWSQNASNSEYVEKERMLALRRAFPQVRPQQKAKLSICPMNIEPHADLPVDMKDYYHFGEL